jgi:hypothetical protein
MQIYKKMSCQLDSMQSILLTFSLSLIFVLQGCYKKQDTILKVYVRNSNGQIVAGANVKIYAEPTDTSKQNESIINFNDNTDEKGIVSFNLNELYESGQTGVAILKAKAGYLNLSGENIVPITEEKTNETFIEIQ